MDSAFGVEHVSKSVKGFRDATKVERAASKLGLKRLYQHSSRQTTYQGGSSKVSFARSPGTWALKPKNYETFSRDGKMVSQKSTGGGLTNKGKAAAAGAGAAGVGGAGYATHRKIKKNQGETMHSAFGVDHGDNISKGLKPSHVASMERVLSSATPGVANRKEAYSAYRLASKKSNIKPNLGRSSTDAENRAFKMANGRATKRNAQSIATARKGSV